MSTLGVILLGMLAFVELVVVGSAVLMASRSAREGTEATLGCSSVFAALVLTPTLMLNSSLLAGLNSTGGFWAKFGLIFGLPSLLAAILISLGFAAAKRPTSSSRGLYAAGLLAAAVYAFWLLYATARDAPTLLAFDPLVSAMLSLAGIPLALIVGSVAFRRVVPRTVRPPSDPEDGDITYIPPDRTHLN